MKDYKVLFADLDGTLIDTISGDTFPKGIWDIRFRFDVLDRIKKLGLEHIIIVTNQGGIEKGFVQEHHFLHKIRFVQFALMEYLNTPHVWYQYCPYNDKNHPERKPNVGMLEKAFDIVNSGLRFTDAGIVPLKKEDCIMIGDASGKPNQFSSSDKDTAKNFGIDYVDVEDFVKDGILIDLDNS